MNILEFFHIHFFLAFLAGCCIYYLIKLILRGIIISIRGYPPSHCDASGDVKEEKDEKEEE